jgi:hypothetical protein
MKDHPILFSGQMVRAILNGRKTQTRQVIKPQPKFIEQSGRWYWEKALDVHGHPFVDASRKWWEYYGTSPYGIPGDRLVCCRITLEVTAVRVERLQEIGEEDCRAEGLEDFYGSNAPYSDGRTRFMDAWNTLNAKRGYSWESNPWVWVIEFGRMEST